VFQAGSILLDALENALKVSTAIIAAKSDFQAPHIGGEKKVEEVQDRLAVVTIVLEFFLREESSTTAPRVPSTKRTEKVL